VLFVFRWGDAFVVCALQERSLCVAGSIALLMAIAASHYFRTLFRDDLQLLEPNWLSTNVKLDENALSSQYMSRMMPPRGTVQRDRSYFVLSWEFVSGRLCVLNTQKEGCSASHTPRQWSMSPSMFLNLLCSVQDIPTITQFICRPGRSGSSKAGGSLSWTTLIDIPIAVSVARRHQLSVICSRAEIETLCQFRLFKGDWMTESPPPDVAHDHE
jgi:hypothetical protein